jgi:hypothetical protein
VEVAQGRVADRPFARTVYSIAAQRFTGDLVLREGERRYKTSWEDGRVVAAESPAPADNAARVALAAGLVTSTDVSATLETLSRTPGADAIQVLSQLARLKADQIAALKRRLLAQRAARAFALPDAIYVLDNARSLRADPDVPPLDARWLVYFGVRTHYTVDRLERELGGLLDRGLKLADDATPALPAFAFGEGERAVMDRLAQRAWTPRQLLGACAGIEGRLVLSVLYALVACDCLEPGTVPIPTGPIARGTETQPPPIADGSVSGSEALSARRRSSTGTAPPPTGERPLAHGTVRRLLFPGQGTSPPPTSGRARRASSRPPIGEETSPGESRQAATPPSRQTGQTPGSRQTGETSPSRQTGETSPSRQTGETSPSRQTGETSPSRRTGETSPSRRTGETSPSRQTGETADDRSATRSRTRTSSAPPVSSRPASTPPPTRTRTTSSPPVSSRPASTPPPTRAGSTSSPPPIRPGSTPPPTRTRTTSSPPLRPHSTTMPPILRRAHPTTMPPTGSRAAATEIRKMISDKIQALDRGADHYSILGVSSGAKADEVRAAYFAIAKRIHPDRLRAVGVTDVDNDAQRLFARINQAFGVLSDPQRRADYSVMISAGGEQAVRKAQADAEEKAGRVLRAEETFRRGEMALRRSMFEQARALFEEAVSLNDEEAEYHALLAWATWLSAPNKTVVATEVQKRLAHALAMSPQCVPAHFYGGQVAKHSGQTQAAIDAFRRVISLEPGHSEAALELRVLRGRLRKK